MMQENTHENRYNQDLMSHDEMRQYASMQVREIERYKWCLGERLGYDPLRDRELNAIAKEWIDNYAAGFRAQYETHRRRRQNGGSALHTAA